MWPFLCSKQPEHVALALEIQQDLLETDTLDPNFYIKSR